MLLCITITCSLYFSTYRNQDVYYSVIITDGCSGTHMYYCKYFTDFFKDRIHNIYFDVIKRFLNTYYKQIEI